MGTMVMSAGRTLETYARETAITRERTPAQLYACRSKSGFTSFKLNGWHNLPHIVSGLLGLAIWRRPDSARIRARVRRDDGARRRPHRMTSRAGRRRVS
jgi:hypothetical protein